MTDNKNLNARVKKLETRKSGNRFTVIFNDVVYIDGKQMTLDEYQATNPKPDRVINLTWGDK